MTSRFEEPLPCAYRLIRGHGLVMKRQQETQMTSVSGLFVPSYGVMLRDLTGYVEITDVT